MGEYTSRLTIRVRYRPAQANPLFASLTEVRTTVPSQRPDESSGTGPAARARSILPGVFAIHSRRLGEHYSAYTLGCEFSKGTIRGRSEVLTSQTPPVGQFDLQQTGPLRGCCRCSSAMMNSFFSRSRSCKLRFRNVANIRHGEGEPDGQMAYAVETAVNRSSAARRPQGPGDGGTLVFRGENGAP